MLLLLGLKIMSKAKVKTNKQIIFPKLLIKYKNQSNDDVQIQLNQEDFADFFAHNCHTACSVLLEHNPNFTNQFAKLILCRGFHEDCTSQHSWIAAFIEEQETYDIYDTNNPNMVIIDPTIWSYQDQTEYELELYSELLENEGYDLGFNYLTTDSFNQYRHLLHPQIQIIQSLHNHEDMLKYHSHGNKSLDYDDYKNTHEPLFRIHCVLDEIVCPIGNLRYLLDSNYLYLKVTSQQSNDVVDLDKVIGCFIDDKMDLTKESIPLVRYNITHYLSKHFPAFLPLDYKTMFVM